MTHICVLSIDAGRRDHPRPFLILIEYDRVGFDVALEDLETGLVRDSVAVSEREVARVLVARHIMSRSGGEEGYRAGCTGGLAVVCFGGAAGVLWTMASV